MGHSKRNRNEEEEGRKTGKLGLECIGCFGSG